MIENWELKNRIDPKTGSIAYCLLCDGTEQDIRLLARKLKGYVKDISPAQAPYAYLLELPTDMDENTQDKVRIAIEEGISQAKKVDTFVPGGAVGDPLFSTHTNTNRKTIDPAAAQPHALEPENPVQFQQLQVAMNDDPETAVAKEVVPEGTPVNGPRTLDGARAQQASQISISDQDMLLKDMEKSVLGKIPLDDILSAQTRYDMFIDVNQVPPAQPSDPQPPAPAARADAPTPASFNVFDPNSADNDNLDVEEVHTITDKLTKKDMDFVNNMHTQPKADAPAPEQPAAAPEQPAAVPPPAVAKTPQNTAAPAVAKTPTQRMAFAPASEHTLQRESLPDITVRAANNQTPPSPFDEKTNRLTTQVPPADPQPPHKTVLRLRPIAAAPQEPQPPQEPGKTVLRLRRKDGSSADTVRIKPLRSTVSAEKTALNLKANPSKPIDHSIEIPISELKKHNWSLEVPLVPTYTLNNMVMSVNRFAHATAISVLENPGKMYNPLVLHGTTGTGKTHFLNALAFAFSKKFGQEHIFMTNGVRLSRGIQRYVMEGNIAKFEDFMKSVQVLLIDDIHLLAINEQNREFISKLLASFLQEQKQIIITSKYPPESLEKLEELIKFRLDAGWISELKPATGTTHLRIVKKMLIENGVDLNDTQIEEFFGGDNMTLGTVTRSIRRLKVLENLLFQNLEKDKKSQAAIFEKLLATKGEDASSELFKKDPATVTQLPPPGKGEWGRIGIFYPQNCSNMMNWIVYALDKRAKELGIEGGFEIVVRSSYSTESIISSAFKIANLCDNKKLKGAIILGPKPDTCDPSVRENFYDILTHMLEIMLIRCGIINYENVRLPSTYVKLISELMR